MNEEVRLIAARRVFDMEKSVERFEPIATESTVLHPVISAWEAGITEEEAKSILNDDGNTWVLDSVGHKLRAAFDIAEN